MRNLEYELLASRREISVNQRRRDYFLFRVKFLSYCSFTVQEKTQIIEGRFMHTIRLFV